MAENVTEKQSSFPLKRVLIGVTGSVATVKLGNFISELLCSKKVEIQVVATEHSLHFFKIDQIPVKVYRDEDEWQGWQKMKDPVLHIELRKWADVMVVAPLDANTMAKLANGICDNLLTCIVRAWDLTKPLIFCPAMNTFMWNHPLTTNHIGVLCEMGYVYVPPIAKTLACGDTETVVESFFTGFSFWAFLIIITQAANGLIMSAVMKHASNITRLIIIACAMLVTTFLSVLLFSLQLNIFFIMAFTLVVIALKFYHT